MILNENSENESIIKILLLEDTPSDAEFIEKELKKKKLRYKLVHIDNKKQFFQWLSNYKPDIILSDYKLPTINGLGALAIARNIYPEIPFIIVTGSLNEEVAVECMRTGADDYILKENLTRLVPAIHSAINKKKLEEQKEQSVNHLIESEERFHTLADNMFPLAWMADSDCNIFWYNKRWFEFTELNNEELQNSGWQSMLHPADYIRVVEGIEHSKLNGISWEDTFRLRNNRGEYKWFVSRLLPIFNEGGNITRWFGTSTDINEQKKAEERLQKSAKRLERSNRDLEQFAYVASHDLQEPIRMVKIYADLLNLLYKDKLDENARQFLGFLTEGSSRMQQLVDGLLQYSRINQTLSYEQIDCNKVLAEVIKDLLVIIKETKAVIRYNNLPSLKADKILLRIVFQNLIQNSLKFHKGEPEITITCETRESMWLFAVKDNGIGIEKEYLEKIFIIFQRLHKREQYPGTGIGLALVKKIVNTHGGDVCVESELGKGSIFYFTLPM